MPSRALPQNFYLHVGSRVELVPVLVQVLILTLYQCQYVLVLYALALGNTASTECATRCHAHAFTSGPESPMHLANEEGGNNMRGDLGGGLIAIRVFLDSETLSIKGSNGAIVSSS